MDVLDTLMAFSELLDDLVLKYGFFGIVAAMTAESAGIPFASALVILTAGKLIATGKITIFGAISASVIGITLGSLISYLIGYLGRKLGMAISNTIFHRKFKKVPYQHTKINDLYDRYGNFALVVAQLFGTTRTFISFPAGAMSMNILLFLAYTTVGGFIFSVFAIVVSIFLNKIMTIIFELMHEILALPYWVWPVFLLTLIIMVVFVLKLWNKYQKKA